jgi:hypothetical protein
LRLNRLKPPTPRWTRRGCVRPRSYYGRATETGILASVKLLRGTGESADSMGM